MVKMDKVKSYEKTDTDVIFRYKTDGKKYKVTVPLYLEDGTENPNAKEYLELYNKEEIKSQKIAKGLGRIVITAGVLCAASSFRVNYRLCHEPAYFQEHFEDVNNVALAGVGGGVYACLGSVMTYAASEKIKELKKEQKSRK